MKRIRVRMLRTKDWLICGENYLVASDVAQELIAIGAAVELFEVNPAGPKECKPVTPSEVKTTDIIGKKKVKTRAS